jgi:hypothetical protein
MELLSLRTVPLMSPILALVPLGSSKIETSLSTDEAVERLKKGIRFRPNMMLAFLGSSAGELVGKWRESGFTVTRRISYQNTYLPFGKGVVRAAGTGSEIQLQFSAPFSGLMVLAFALGGYLVFSKGSTDQFLLTITIGVLAHIVSVLLFFWEKKKIDRRLRELLGKSGSA